MVLQALCICAPIHWYNSQWRWHIPANCQMISTCSLSRYNYKVPIFIAYVIKGFLAIGIGMELGHPLIFEWIPGIQCNDGLWLLIFGKTYRLILATLPFFLKKIFWKSHTLPWTELMEVMIENALFVNNTCSPFIHCHSYFSMHCKPVHVKPINN